MKVCILASSSAGNCTYIASGDTSILIDAGLSARETAARLEAIGASAEALQGICLSHEHSDHVAGLRVLQSRYGIPIYANAGTADAVALLPKHEALNWKIFSTGSPFTIGGLRIEPFSVPHDAYEPVGFVVSDSVHRIGVVTDMGVATTLVRQRLSGCHALVIESNYDDLLLRNSDRPWPLKQRIMGRQGHLSNQHAAELLGEIASPALRRIYLAHLSTDCNQPHLALKTMREGLTRAAAAPEVQLTYPDRATELWLIEG
jgi:phosphoribosyl 1,2-cyclic phosphodiesterase